MELTLEKKILFTLQAMHEKLTAMKQELSNAAQRCESLSGTEYAEQAPGDEESAIATLASQVDENMLDSVNQVSSCNLSPMCWSLENTSQSYLWSN